MTWDRPWVSLFYVLVTLLFLFEFWAIFDNKDHTPLITHIIVAEVPAWVTLGFLFWLLLHFAIRYFKWTGWGPL